MSYQPEPDCHSRNKVEVELDLSNYATKFDVKKKQQALIHQIWLKKGKVGKVSIDKLKTAATNLSKISNVVDNAVFKKTAYDKLVVEINAIDKQMLVN